MEKNHASAERNGTQNGNGNGNGIGYRLRTLRLDRIGRLEQHRKDFDDEKLRSLAFSIATDGLLAPPVVARLSTANAVLLLAEVNAVYERDEEQRYELKHLPASVEGGETVYYVLVAGERRYRACRMLYANGNIDYAAWDSSPANAPQFWRNLRKGSATCNMVGDVDPHTFMRIQHKENSYEPPHPEEQARGHMSWYMACKRQNPKLTLVAYARSVGRSSSYIHSLFRFLSLPEHIRLKTGKRGGLTFALALKLKRLRDLGASQDEFDNILRRVELEQPTVKRCRAWVTEWHREKMSGQTSIFDAIRGAEPQRLETRRMLRVVDARMTTVAKRDLDFLRRLRSLVDSGKLGGVDAIFSSPSAARNAIRVLEFVRELLPWIVASVTRKEAAFAERLLAESAEDEAVLREFLATLGGDEGEGT